MRQFSKKAAMVILAVAVIAGCRKTNGNNSNATKTQMLTSGSWKITSDYVDPPIDTDRDGHPDYELINSMDACHRDDLFIFKADGTYIHDEGASKCDPLAPQIEEESNWMFSTDESLILIGDPGSMWPAHVVELTSTVFKMKYVDTIGSVIYTEVLTFKH
ncbi:hypothetical protein [Pinibacter soli]|uniref:Lipocalin-like domain-containing protein n=1 Tax=Pinibacter soli TaxID=3044211 RepID=A0ABT6RI95_9BACT|nr:hypothetical protein [Pinibacter soli]MDI3322297.1 hypothetical protein [Pinibacter soli]